MLDDMLEHSPTFVALGLVTGDATGYNLDSMTSGWRS